MLFQSRPRLFPIIAVIASSYEALTAFGFLHLHIGNLPVGLICGAALVIASIAVYMKSSAKTLVTATTAVTLVGATQVLSALHFH
jgi:hypothetical protein